jgi:hypothetical protein
MDKLVMALGPAFAAGFALQRLLEILDPWLDKIKIVKENKKIVLGLISLIIGLILAFGIGLRVLRPLGVTTADFLDAVTTALIVSAGTEGFNSILKFLGYIKEDRKAAAAMRMLNQEVQAAMIRLERLV